MEQKGQSAVEYILMLAISLLILSAILFGVNIIIGKSYAQSDLDSAIRTVDELKQAADFVYIHGHPAKATVYSYVPASMIAGQIETSTDNYNNTLNIRLAMGSSYTDVYRVTKARYVQWNGGSGPLNCTINAGTCKSGYYGFSVRSSCDDMQNPSCPIIIEVKTS